MDWDSLSPSVVGSHYDSLSAETKSEPGDNDIIEELEWPYKLKNEQEEDGDEEEGEDGDEEQGEDGDEDKGEDGDEEERTVIMRRKEKAIRTEEKSTCFRG
jgi:hypothetical protein